MLQVVQKVNFYICNKRCFLFSPIQKFYNTILLLIQTFHELQIKAYDYTFLRLQINSFSSRIFLIPAADFHYLSK